MIHCADLHLDAPFTSLGKGTFSAERRKELKASFEKIIALVEEKNADYLIISGDLYEHHYATGNTMRWLNEQFQKILDKPCILVPGNHDPYVANSWYRNYPWSPNVHILSTNAPDYLDEQNGAYFYGIGFDTFHQNQLPKARMPQIRSDRINLCLFHGTVNLGLTQNPYNPVDMKALIDMGFDYYALGHFHNRNETLADHGMLNPGSPEPLGFDEPAEHGVYWVSIEKEDGNVRRDYNFLPVQKRRFIELNVDVGGVESEAQLFTELDKHFSSMEYQNDLLKVKLTGRIAPDFRIDTQVLEQQFTYACAYLEVLDCTRPEYNLEQMAAEDNITGVFIRMIQQRLEKADNEEKLVLEKALYLGLEALIHGRIQAF